MKRLKKKKKKQLQRNAELKINLTILLIRGKFCTAKSGFQPREHSPADQSPLQLPAGPLQLRSSVGLGEGKIFA